MKRLAILLGSSAAVATAVLIGSAFGQGEKFPGTELDQTMDPASLTAAFRPLKIKESSSGIFGDYYSSYTFQFAQLGISGSSGNDRMLELFEILPVSWTKDEIVKVYGQEFLATYILEPSIDDLRKFANGEPLPSPKLKLKLIRASGIGTIEPFPGLDANSYRSTLQSLSGTGERALRASDRTAALSNMKQAALGLIMYVSDYDDVLPYTSSTGDMQKVVEPYLKNNDVWKSRNPKGGRVLYNMAVSGAAMTSIDAPAETPMLYDSLAWPDGTHLIGYSDGHVKFESEDGWNRIQRYFRAKFKKVGKPIKVP